MAHHVSQGLAPACPLVSQPYATINWSRQRQYLDKGNDAEGEGVAPFIAGSRTMALVV